MVNDRHAWFDRVELAGKPAPDLHLDNNPTAVLAIANVQFGYVRHFTIGPVFSGIGVSPSLSAVPNQLVPRYYGRVARGLDVFFVIRPLRYTMWRDQGAVPCFAHRRFGWP
jgi:hypothetical protein